LQHGQPFEDDQRAFTELTGLRKLEVSESLIWLIREHSVVFER
jgi:hypothetical protein